jgi:benzoyl-CoA reductase/2-hydroxyglutaryl-CoA dehydratase subunit BcrC/BadD/HgdB
MENYGQVYLKKLETIQNLPKMIRYEAIRSILRSNYSELEQVIRGGEHYAASSLFVPSEILTSFDIKWLFPELVAVTLCQMNVIKDLSPIMNKEFSDFPCFCVGMKGLIGAYRFQVLPKPAFIVASSAMCDDAMKMWNLIGREYGIDLYNFDIPYDSENENAQRYLADQLREMTEFISKKAGKAFDEEKLKKTIRLSNEANLHRQKIFKLRQQNPALLRLNDLFSLYPFFTRFGHESTVEVYRTLHRELQAVIDNDTLPLSKDHHRILWLGMIPLISMPFLSYIEKDLNMGIVAEELMYYADFDWLDENAPFESLARKVIRYHTVGTIRNRLGKIQKFIEDYGIEGVIHFSHTSCRSFNGGAKFVKDFCSRKGLPFIELSGDVGNKDDFQLEALKTRIEAFREVLDGKVKAV